MKARLKVVGAIVALLMLLGGGLLMYVLRSDELRERLRVRMVAEIEKATGARVEMKKFDFHWYGWSVWVEGLVLHGREEPGKAPYVVIPHAKLSLTVRSWFSRDVDLNSLVIDKPEVHIYVAPDGTTNQPSPATPATGDTIGKLLKLKIRQLSIRDGIFEYDTRQMPLRVEARELDAQLDWEAGPQYRARFNIGALTLPVLEQTRLEGVLLLSSGGLKFERLRLDRNQSWVEARGAMDGFKSPVFRVDFNASFRAGDVPDSPIRDGKADLQGTFHMAGDTPWHAEGTMRAGGIGYRSKDVRIDGIGVESPFAVNARELTLSRARVSSLGSTWSGSAVLTDWKTFQLKGEVQGLELDRAWAVASREGLPWSGIMTGPVEASGSITNGGVQGMKVKGALQVVPEPDQVPVTGEVMVSWSQDTRRIDLDTSHLSVNQTRINFRGVLGDRLEVSLVSSAPSDLQPVIRIFTKEKDFEVPIDLAQGQATVTARVDGPIDDPVVSGTAQLRNLVVRGITIDRLDTSFSLSNQGVAFEKLAAVRNQTSLRGEVRIPLENWKLSSTGALRAHLKLENGDAAELQRLAGIEPTLKLRFGGELDASGSLDQPNGTLRFQGTQLEFGGEAFDKASGDLTLRSNGDEQLSGNLQLGTGRATVEGVYRHSKGDWRNGSGTLKVAEKGFELSSMLAVRSRTGLAGPITLDGNIDFTMSDGKPRLDRISAVARADALTLEARPLGSARIEANTVGEAIGMSNTFVVEGRRITGSSLIQLDKDYTAEGVLRIPRIPFALIRRIVDAPEPGQTQEPLPVQGFVEGEVVWKAPLAAPSRGSADITLTRFQVRPRAGSIPETDIDTSELVVTNNGPVSLNLDAKALRVRSARLQALNTDLSLSGQYVFGAMVPWEFSLRGAADLALISNFEPNIVASGTATVDGSLRGAASDPLVSGKMQIKNASFYLRDFPNGIEDAEGTITFERNRASIESFKGRTGGGQFELQGFIGLNQGESTYRLQAKATNVRVRYPEGVSTTLDADVSLTGSSTRSLLSGNIMVQRAAFNARTDFASVVGSAGSPIPTPVGQNEFLRNLLFDIRIRTTANATIQSNYTQDLTADAELRLRGSPAKPVLLGSVKASQGEVNFFGNRYTVSRGEILFYNVATIQPAVDLNLETRVRGVTVFISVTGPLSKLNVNYRSEPPLHSTDIFALLTVGRAPDGAVTTLPSTSDPNKAVIPGGSSNSLLGGALSSAVSSRVEKFFGKSRIKIDPQMTGVENIPQARLTIEQSISRDVTLTLVTNLARSQQQLVRLEWDLSREWQLILVRDENGVFGADFLYRKRFK